MEENTEEEKTFESISEYLEYMKEQGEQEESSQQNEVSNELADENIDTYEDETAEEVEGHTGLIEEETLEEPVTSEDIQVLEYPNESAEEVQEKKEQKPPKFRKMIKIKRD